MDIFDQLLRRRLCRRKNLHGSAEAYLFSRIELLFLPRCGGGLSYWFSAGSHGELEVQHQPLCGWFFDGDGRFVCGWLCPFGLVQDLCHKIPFFKKINRFPGDRILRYLKYIILLVFVILMPLFVVDIVGQGGPAFCKYICPSGTLTGSIPLVFKNPGLQPMVGFLFRWKVAILLVTLLAAIIIYRPFCKYICPLGAAYALFNRVSFGGLWVDKEKCVNCGACSKVCKMGVDPLKMPGSAECIRCGECARVCPKDAIHLGFRFRVKKEKISVLKKE